MGVCIEVCIDGLSDDVSTLFREFILRKRLRTSASRVSGVASEEAFELALVKPFRLSVEASINNNNKVKLQVETSDVSYFQWLR